MKLCNKTVRDISLYVYKLMDANPKAAKMEVLQRLKARLDFLLERKRYRDAEELAFEILLTLEPLRTDKNEIKEARG